MDTDDIARQIQRLTHHDPFIRQDAARTLGVRGDARAVAPLIAALHDITPDVRGQAAAALGRVGDARAIRPLIATLLLRENALRRAAYSTLISLGNPVAAHRGDLRDIASLLKDVREGRARRSRPPVALLVETLTDQDTTVPWLAAAQALGEIAERLPRPELRGALSCLRALADCALSDEQRDVCWGAARKIEDMTLPLMDLPLPAGAPLPAADGLPLPAVASAPNADSLPIASVDVPVCVPPTDAEGRLRWWQRWAYVLRWRGRHG